MALGLLSAIITALFAAGVAYEVATRSKNLKVIGQNDITEEDCAKLCAQLRIRWNEKCLAESDEASTLVRWHQAALASAGAAAAATALMNASVAAAASVLGALAAAFLAAAALIAVALAVAAAGVTYSALIAFLNAQKVANDSRAALSSARTQMTTTCGEDQMLACNSKLPPCP